MRQVARWISIVLHPFVMMVLSVAVIAERRGGRKEALWSVGLIGLFSVLPIALLMASQVRRGAWRDVDASGRNERPMLYGAGIGGMAAMGCYLAVFEPGSFLLGGTLVMLGLLAVCGVLTIWVKVSLHMAAATSAVTVLVLMNSTLGWILGCVLPMLGWSRLALGRHGWPEVALGFLLGLMAGMLMGWGRV